MACSIALTALFSAAIECAEYDVPMPLASMRCFASSKFLISLSMVIIPTPSAASRVDLCG
jgi:hypothetical protein